MKKPPHFSIVEHYEECLARHGDNHLGVDWPNSEDANIRYHVMLELVRDTNSTASLLDFGCGASHLYPVLLASGHSRLSYAGLDASTAFYELSRSKYPNNQYYCLDVLSEADALPMHDYVVMNGVFTEKRSMTHKQMLDYFHRTIKTVYGKARKGLAFNVMSKLVDWERDDLFHLALDDLAAFVVKELGRNFVIRNDYGLYEYTVYVYKDANHG
jgi:SAM-dependent methyltransferase